MCVTVTSRVCAWTGLEGDGRFVGTGWTATLDAGEPPRQETGPAGAGASRRQLQARLSERPHLGAPRRAGLGGLGADQTAARAPAAHAQRPAARRPAATVPPQPLGGGARAARLLRRLPGRGEWQLKGQKRPV